MAPTALALVKTHPFAGNAALKGLRPTPVPMPPYSAHATPYRWMLRSEVSTATAEREHVYRPELEDRVDRLMGGRSNSWVMHADNQSALFDEFFRTVVPKTSLVFFYAKHTPLADDPQRVLVGAARVAHIDLPRLYETTSDPAFPSLLWETVVLHTLRPEMTDGILLPYQALLAAADADPAVDLTPCVAHAPADAWSAFSFVTEHVSHDIAIDALLGIEQSARAACQIVDGIPPAAFAWIDEQVNRLWQLRGPCPGLGSAFSAFGIDRGTLCAHALARHIPEGADPWPVVEKAFADPEGLGPEVARHLTPTQCLKWAKLDEERKELLRLLSRFALTTDQARRWYRDRDAWAPTALTDRVIIENPYLLYEEDRMAPDPIAAGTVDRGALPDESIAIAYPLPKPSAMIDNLDPRRVRALVVDVLEGAASSGHTLLPELDVATSVRDRPLGQPCPLDVDTLAALDLSASTLTTATGPLASAALASGRAALQLRRLVSAGALIRTAVEQRLRAPRHPNCPDFTPALSADLGPLPTDGDGRQLEERARSEKLAALTELFESRISVLIGSAGTGKTTLLRVLCADDAVRRGGVLLLAPTGKARVQLTTKVGLPGFTIAQFLTPSKRFLTDTGRYRVTGDTAARTKTVKTVVIDEASMLTEEQFAATLDALAGVERLILVGDHRQLPPIGAGRPFVDIVTRLTQSGVDAQFPRVTPAYAELVVQRRQEGADRDDLQLAAWFGGNELSADADEVWQRLRAGDDMPTLRAVRWTRATMREDIVRVLTEELGLPPGDQVAAFEQSYGGGPIDGQGRVWFNWASGGGAGKRAEGWQLLAPVRARAWGTTELNRHIKSRFRRHALDAALKPPWQRWFPKPLGAEQIVYGDKVINIRNTTVSEKRVYPAKDALRYVANGEIGVAVGQTKNGKVTWTPNKLEVEFSSQPGFKYDFYDWSDAGDASLELAWAITVHKSQGSEFELVILVLPAAVRSLSRELLYTALTRQRRRVVLFHEGELDALIEAAAPSNSETAQRLTNLFEAPAPIDVAGQRLDDRLIHRTTSGVLVRSKNEVIIANILTELGVDWTYEEPFTGDDGRVVRPDFTIRTDAGMTVLWEHLGLLDDVQYRRKWELKRAWYEANGVLPAGAATARATLLTTEDTSGVDSEGWAEAARSLFAL
jgi:hypothetical protein